MHGWPDGSAQIWIVLDQCRVNIAVHFTSTQCDCHNAVYITQPRPQTRTSNISVRRSDPVEQAVHGEGHGQDNVAGPHAVPPSIRPTSHHSLRRIGTPSTLACARWHSLLTDSPVICLRCKASHLGDGVVADGLVDVVAEVGVAAPDARVDPADLDGGLRVGPGRSGASCRSQGRSGASCRSQGRRQYHGKVLPPRNEGGRSRTVGEGGTLSTQS